MAGLTRQSLFDKFHFEAERNILHQQKHTVDLEFHESLKTPEEEKMPRLLQNNVDNFYAGGYFQDLQEYHPLREFTRLEKEVYGNRELVTIFEILEAVKVQSNLSRKKPQGFLHVAIVGAAGSGKTTFMRRFARDAVNGKFKQLQSEKQIVHMVDCRGFQQDAKISVADFLFKFMTHKPSDDVLKCGYKWMLENSDKILLLVDSLDTLLFELDNESQIIDPHGLSSPSTILYNIFLGRIFPKARVISSSREVKIRNYKGDLRPDKIISLRGLTYDSIHYLVFGFLDEQEAEKIWNNFLKQCPDLLALCENPLFLVLTLVGLREGSESSSIPKNVSGVLEKVLESLIRSEHARTIDQDNQGYVIKALNKMKKLSIQGTEEGRVLFRVDDLKMVKLTIDEITDMTIIAPGSFKQPQYQQILEGSAESVSFMFAHQCFQEFLCSLGFSELALEEFKKLALDRIHRPHYSVVRRMLCGIVMNALVFEQASNQLLQVSPDIEEMRLLLAASMKQALERALVSKDRNDLLELIRAIHEAGDGARLIVPEDFEEIVLINTSLTEADLHAISSSISHCITLHHLLLHGCDITEECLKIFISKLGKTSLQILTLYIGSNKNLDEKALTLIGEIISSRGVRDLCLPACSLTAESITALNNSLGDTKLYSLEVGGNIGLGEKGLAAIGNFLQERNVRELGLQNCELEYGGLLALDSALQMQMLDILRLSFNTDLGEKGYAFLGDFIRRHGVQNLSLEGCKLTHDEIKALDSSLADATMELINISSNVLGMNGMSAFGDLVRAHSLRWVVLLGLSLNSDLLQSFSKGLSNAKLEHLDVSNNEGVGESGMKSLAQIVKTSEVKILAIMGSRLEAQEGRAFANALGSTKVEILHLSKEVTYRRMGHMSANAPPQIAAAAEMLPNVSTCLDFNGFDLSVKDRQLLRHKLDELYPNEPKVTFGGKRLRYTNQWYDTKAVLSTFRDKEQEDPKISTNKSGDTEENICIVKTTVDSSGGQVAVGGCIIDFPPNAFVEDSEIVASTSIRKYDEQQSTECFTVSPVLRCTSSKKLKKLAKMKIPTWASTKDPDILLRVRCKKEGEGKEWKVIKSMRLCDVEEGMVQVECDEFSLYDLVIDFFRQLLGLTQVHVKGHLYYDHQGNFCYGLHVDNETAKQKCFEDFVSTDYTASPSIAEAIAVCENDKVKFCLQCVTDNFTLDRENKEFAITKEILSGRPSYFRSLLVPIPKIDEEVIFICQVEKMGHGKVEDTFRILWPRPKGAAQQPAIRADTVIVG